MAEKLDSINWGEFMRVFSIALVATALMLSGCATKRYGRLTPVSGAESANYTCREIAIELSKVEAFEDAIKEGSKTNFASVAGFLGDWGIGNSMEKGAAERSAAARRQQLRQLDAQKGCTAQTATAPTS